jgi:hypothetical protein
VDGVAWASDAGAERAGVPITVPGIYTLAGAKIGSGANNYVIAITLYNIPGPGTYPLGVGAQIVGGNAQISNATSGWSTPLSGAAGSITITVLTASRIEGTFNFTATPILAGTTGTKTVTDGNFALDVKPTGTIGPLPDNAGSKVTATIGGTAWTASAAAGSYVTTTTGIFVVTGSNDTRGIGISMSGVTGPGTFTLGTAPGGATRTLTVSSVSNPTANSWSSSGTGGGGTVTVTSITATRLKGTFSGTLGPAPGTTTTGTVTVTNGVFDIGRP